MGYPVKINRKDGSLNVFQKEKITQLTAWNNHRRISHRNRNNRHIIKQQGSKKSHGKRMVQVLQKIFFFTEYDIFQKAVE